MDRNIEILYKKDNLIKLELSNYHKCLINALRRIVIAEIPTVAFKTSPADYSDISITSNTCSLHNEFIQHRLCLIPIHITDIDNFDKDRYEFSINILNEGSNVLNVTSEHFQIKDLYSGEFLDREEVKKIFPPSEYGEYILITKLKHNNGEELVFNGKACVGIGKENARWSPCCQSIIINKIDNEVAEEELNKILANMDNLNASEIEKLRKKFYNFDAERYFIKNNNGEACVFEFTIESIGVIKPEILFKKSLKILNNKLDELIENISDKEYVEIVKADTLMNAYDIIITDGDHTLGNLIQYYLYDNYKKSGRINFSGYKIPHPLENKLLIRVDLIQESDNNSDNLIMQLLIDIIGVIKSDIIEIQNKFDLIILD